MTRKRNDQPLEIRWGIIGCGDVCERKSGPAFRKVPGSSLLAVAGRDLAKARSFAQRHGIPRAYGSAQELLADRLVNAVYVATPPSSHCELAIAAAEAGKPVLVEKPMAVTPQQCRRMIDACSLNGVLLMVAYYRRFWPTTQRIHELVANGALGEVRHARLYFTFPPRTPPQGPRGWRWDPSVAGGGALMDVGSHRIDLLHAFFGPAAEVMAWVDPHGPEAVERTVSATIAYRNGVVASLLMDEGVGFPEDALEIHGTRGRLIARPLDTSVTVQTLAGGRKTYSFQPPSPTHLGLVAHFLDALRGEARPLVSGEEGMQANLVIDAIYRSAEERRAVAIDDGSG